jgi:hypothetical protein
MRQNGYFELLSVLFIRLVNVSLERTLFAPPTSFDALQSSRAPKNRNGSLCAIAARLI